jgi:hypothetical protein
VDFCAIDVIHFEQHGNQSVQQNRRSVLREREMIIMIKRPLAVSGPRERAIIWGIPQQTCKRKDLNQTMCAYFPYPVVNRAC